MNWKNAGIVILIMFAVWLPLDILTYVFTGEDLPRMVVFGIGIVVGFFTFEKFPMFKGD